MKTIAIIPARIGSKGLPNKNILSLCGKPLIAYTIEAAMESEKLDEVYVSTESKKIASVAKEYGIEVLDRPMELAGDESSIDDVLKHAVTYHISNPDTIVSLQPTTPLRTASDIDEAIRIYLFSGCDSVVSVSKSRETPYRTFKIKDSYDEKVLEPLHPMLFCRRRQDLPATYVVNGGIYITDYTNIVTSMGFFDEVTIPYIMPYVRSIDIDDEFDFRLVEFIMGCRK